MLDDQPISMTINAYEAAINDVKKTAQQALIDKLREPDEETIKSVYDYLTTFPQLEVYRQDSLKILKAIADHLSQDAGKSDG